MNYVIIGNSAAGVGAIEGIRSVDGEGAITLVSDEPHPVYSRPITAHWVAGEENCEAKLRLRPETFYDDLRVEARLGVRATGLDLEQKRVSLADGSEVPYDRLLLATGSSPRFPDVPGRDLEGAHFFWTYDQARQVRERVEQAQTAVVVGAGLIGAQAAVALHQAGLRVVMVELLDRILSTVLDPRGSEIARKVFEANGVQIVTGRSVAEIAGEPDKGVTGVVLDDGRLIECGVVIKSTGIVPNIDLARDAGIGVDMGIRVSSRFETDSPGVFAAGDVAETYDIARGRPFVNANWPNAGEQGRMAGLNMAGRPTDYPGSIGMNSLPLFGIPIVSLGSVQDEEVGEGRQTRIRYKEDRPIYQKLLFKDDRLKGAVLIGETNNAGLLHDLIRSQDRVGWLKDSLLEEKAPFYHFRRERVRAEMEGEVVEWKGSLGSEEHYQKKFDDEKWAERERDERKW